jgi:hypothetical protein
MNVKKRNMMMRQSYLAVIGLFMITLVVAGCSGSHQVNMPMYYRLFLNEAK